MIYHIIAWSIVGLLLLFAKKMYDAGYQARCREERKEARDAELS